MSVRKKISKESLTLRETEECILRCIAKAKEIGIEISVAIVDQYGYLKSFARMDGASWLSPDIAIRKAYTAVAFRRSSAESGTRFRDAVHIASSLNAMSGGKIFLDGGGLVLEKNNQIAGGIGVSGGTSEEDIRCAQAGLLPVS